LSVTCASSHSGAWIVLVADQAEREIGKTQPDGMGQEIRCRAFVAFALRLQLRHSSDALTRAMMREWLFQ